MVEFWLFKKSTVSSKKHIILFVELLILFVAIYK